MLCKLYGHAELDLLRAIRQLGSASHEVNGTLKVRL